MIKKSSFFLFLLLVLVSVTIHSVTVSCTPNEVVTRPPLPPQAPIQLQPKMSGQRLANIIDSLIGITDFTNWTSIFSSIDTSIFPITATLFVPDDTTRFSSTLPSVVDPFLLAYHVVPQSLAFSQLRLFEAGSSLPTLIPDKYILITRNSKDNFTLDNSRLTRPDLFSIDSLVVHGISAILDYKAYGDSHGLSSEDRRIPKKESSLQMTNNTTVISSLPLPLPAREEMIGGEQISCAARSKPSWCWCWPGAV